MSNEHLIVGWHAATAALNNPKTAIREVLISTARDDQRSQRVELLAQRRSLIVRKVDRETLDRLETDAPHQGVAVLLQVQRTTTGSDNELEELLDRLQEPPFLLVLDGVQDPHNLGACLRVADAAGVHGVIVPKDRAVGLTPVVRKAAAGAAENIPLFQVTNLARCLRKLQERNIWLVGLAGEGAQPLYSVDLKGALAVVMGAEGDGIRRLTADTCDHLVHLPMLGSVESLNVSVATGITLYEAVRQRSASASAGRRK